MENPFGGCRASIPIVIAMLFMITSLLPAAAVAAEESLIDRAEEVGNR